MRPMIGVTSLWDNDKGCGWIWQNYLELIWDAGGMPFVLPLNASDEAIEQYVSRCAGFLFTGGQDIAVDRFKCQHPEMCQAPALPRDDLELPLFAAARKAGRPVFGICRGLQLFNVALGGTLIEDIPELTQSSVEHRYRPPAAPSMHPVTIKTDCTLSTFFDTKEITVNSYHHQAIDQVADGLRVTAKSTDDGIIEAVEGTQGAYLMAVQWHPERIYKEYAGQLAMLKHFVDATRS